jgi:hypothetical protein
MYFGARYYDPKVSSWISTDPALGKDYIPEPDFFEPTDEKIQRYAEKKYKLSSITENQKTKFAKELIFDIDRYKDIPGFGGIYYNKNLNAYTYAHSNPVLYKDPDGRITGIEIAAVIVIVGSAVTMAWDFYSGVKDVASKQEIMTVADKCTEMAYSGKFTTGENLKLLSIAGKLESLYVKEMTKVTLDQVSGILEGLSTMPLNEAGWVINKLEEITTDLIEE